MIIWRGLGFLVFVIMVPLVFLFGWILEMIVDRSLPEDTSLIIGLVVAGIIVWFLGKKLNGGSEKVLVDQETGTAYKMGTRHSLFFIPMQFWGPIFIVIGVVLTIKMFI